MCRPACRIIHTGERSTFSPRAARKRSGSFSDEPAAVAASASAAVADMVTGLWRPVRFGENDREKPDAGDAVSMRHRASTACLIIMVELDG